MPQINEERLAQALVSQGVSLPDAQVIAAEAAVAAATVISSAPAPAPAPAPATTPVATITEPLTKSERKEVFVEQRSAELEAAGKPVNTDALEKRFDELSKTTEGRAQITTVVQRAEPEILQAIVPDKVSVPEPAPAPAPTPAPVVTTEQPTPAPAPAPENVRPEELAKGLFTREAPTPGMTAVGPTPQPAAPTETPTLPPAGPVTRDYFDETGNQQGSVLDTAGTPAAVAPTLPAETSAAPVEPSIPPTETPTLPTPTTTPVVPVAKPITNPAADELRAILRRYGLDGLFDTLNKAVISDPTLTRNTDALFGAIRETPIYKERFKGNTERVKKGLPELSEAEYINQEVSYKTNLKNLGMPKGFYDTQEAFANFIANDISPVELAQRIQQGYNAVTQASPEVITQLKRMVPDLTDGDIAAYFLDPTKSGQEIERKARAAQISAAGVLQGRMQITTKQAEELAKQGVTVEQAQQGFYQIGQQEQLFSTTLPGEETLTQEEIVSGVLTNEQAAAQRIARRRRGRTAAFETGGSYAGQGGQQTGLTTVGM